jgi:hypothetical protein
MNAKDLEALVIRQGEYLQAAEKRIEEHVQELQAVREAHMHLVQRADNIVEGFKQELAGRDELIDTLNTGMSWLRQAVDQIQNWIGSDVTDGPLNPEFRPLTARLAQLETLVLARNASAATKRNMTDEDALRVLTGDLKDMAHKDAAEKAGLTYAQVYSCRLEFTFKHVHKTLRDGSTPEAPWKNVWVK